MTTVTSKMLMVDDGRMIAVRTGTQADAAALIEHTQAVLADGAGMCMVSSEFDMTIDAEQRWVETYETDSKRLLLVAEADGDVIGLLECHPLPRKMLQHVAEFVMSIHPAWRGIGIGRFLIDGLLTWARRTESLAKLTLSVRADNAPAIALYERHGFREEGRRIGQIRLPDGSAVDELLMYLQLR